MPAMAEALTFYVKRPRGAWLSGMTEQRRFIQQAELYLIKRQKAHFDVIEM
ncbi:MULTISPECIES: hypothetical protein [Duganella]|uniref:Uncharacterized protein n=1 Tax=Duganella vulcania TaxID=2692166 RepID=A0A845GXA8_9BURK|nr:MULTISPECIES: hypothetical protein [Duganella]MCU6499827.1 hypothetical protein [Rugamonas sp. A1-17]MYM97307.1 hypothetical protein [Duganella vulcania]